MTRLARLQAKVQEAGWDALLVSRPEDVRYLTGARGARVQLLITSQHAVLISHFVDLAQTRSEVPGLPVIRALGLTGIPEIAAQLAAWHARLLAVNLASIPYALHQALGDALDVVRLVSDDDVVCKMRWFKEPDELAAIRRATEINDIAYKQIFRLLVPGVTEREIALATWQAMYEAGAEAVRFLAVQFGEHSALPHYHPTDKMLRRGDFVLLDWVPVYESYWSDETRTVVIGEPTQRQREIYDIVLRAQAAGLTAARPGASGHEADAAARCIIEEAGFGPEFGHSLGHGISEGPSLDRGSTDVLAPGMVVTIEPGIYLPGWGGVRIEDTVIIGEQGAEPLPRTTKEMLVL